VTEIDQLSRLRAEVPARVSAEAERRFHAAFAAECARAASRPATRPPRRARPRVVLGAALVPTAAIAVAVAAIVSAGPHGPAVVSPGSTTPEASTLTAPAGTLTVQELAYRASAAALSARSVAPGQWLYTKTNIKSIPPGGGPPVLNQDQEDWQTADGLHAAWYFKGQLSVYATPTEGRDISYAELSKFPADPRALAKYVYGRELQILGQEPAALNWFMTFDEMAGLFRQFDLPPAVAAEIFRAMPDIPGIRVAKVPGGIAFTMSYNGLADQVILDPASYTVTSVVLTGAQAKYAKKFTLISRVAVAGPGVRP
jgi:hypothetical protein